MPLAHKHHQLPLDLGTPHAGEITSAILAYLSHHGLSFVAYSFDQFQQSFEGRRLHLLLHHMKLFRKSVF